ncbi:hypothetical protein M5689_020672 [Euphorbia peplus]|nr:hypothetical protein M5689_020672 [Euphorbia peplus]
MGIKEDVFPALMVEFYENMYYWANIPDVLYTQVLGKLVTISPSVVFDILGVDLDGAELQASGDERIVVDYPFNFFKADGVSGELAPTKLPKAARYA